MGKRFDQRILRGFPADLIERYSNISTRSQIFLWSLQAWIFIVGFSPRIQIGSLPGDFRAQDFLFLPLIAAVLLIKSRTALITRRLDKESLLLLAYAVAGFIAIIMGLVLGQNPEDVLMRLGVSFRLLEPVGIGLMAMMVFRRVGSFGQVVSSVSIGITFLFNFSWLVVSTVLDFDRALWTFSSKIPSVYGGTLIGEAGVFPSGQFIALAGILFLAIAVSSRLSSITWISIALTALALVGLYLINSRASLAGLALGIALVAIRGAFSSRSNRIRAVVSGFTVLGLGVLFLVVPRLRIEPVLHAIRHRIEIVYLPIFEFARDSFFFGGGIGHSRVSTQAETHNLYFQVLADFGLVGFVVFLLLVLVGLSLFMRSLRLEKRSVERAWLITSVLLILNTLFAGTVQDSNLPVMYTHLSAVIWGGTIASMRHDLRHGVSIVPDILRREPRLP